MVFVETKRQADFIATFLCQEKVPTTSIHGLVLGPFIEKCVNVFCTVTFIVSQAAFLLPLYIHIDIEIEI